MKSSILYDTSICIDFLREGKWAELQKSMNRDLFFSLVVFQELFSGAQDQFTLKGLTHLYHTAKKNDLLVCPQEEHWIECGKVIAKIAKKFGFESIGRSRLVNDVLIALSCISIDAVLITTNKKDFARIAEFCSLEWREPLP